jgi:hypothetical protein
MIDDRTGLRSAGGGGSRSVARGLRSHAGLRGGARGVAWAGARWRCGLAARAGLGGSARGGRGRGARRWHIRCYWRVWFDRVRRRCISSRISSQHGQSQGCIHALWGHIFALGGFVRCICFSNCIGGTRNLTWLE